MRQRRKQHRVVGQRRDQAARQDDLEPPDAVGEPAEHDEERRADQERDADHGVGGERIDLEDDEPPVALRAGPLQPLESASGFSAPGVDLTDLIRGAVRVLCDQLV